MARLLTPLVQTLEERRPRPAGRFEQTVGPKATGVQAGGVLAFLSGKVLGQYEFFADPAGQLLLVAPNIVEVERPLGVSTGRLPAVGLPARGDPPHAVHRGAVAARPLHQPRSTRSSTRPTSTRTRCASGCRRSSASSARRCAAAQDVAGRSSAWSRARPSGGARPADRVDDPARGARRVRDGRRRPGRGPVVGADPGAVRPAPQGRRPGRAAAAPAARARRQDAPVRRGQPVRRRGRRRGRHGRLQPGLDVAGDAARAGRAGRPDAWVERVHGSAPQRLPDRLRPRGARPGAGVAARGASAVLAPAVAAVRLAVRGCAGVRPAACWWPARGGADSLALAAATAFVAPRLGVPAGLVTVDHGLQAGLGRQARPRPPSSAAGSASTRCWSRRVEVGGRRRPEAAARAARYAALAGRPAHGAAGAARPHPRRPGRDRAARARPRAPGRGRWPACGPVDGRWLRPLLGVRRATDPGRLRGLGPAVWDDPHNADPRVHPGPAARARCCPLLEDVAAGGVAEALARTAELLRDDLDALDAPGRRRSPPARRRPCDGRPALAG